MSGSYMAGRHNTDRTINRSNVCFLGWAAICFFNEMRQNMLGKSERRGENKFYVRSRHADGA
jgi:hypothetical protein